MFRAMEMKRMEMERKVLEKSIDEYLESQSKGIVNAIVTCFEEDPIKNDWRKIKIDEFTSFVFDYGKIMVILMDNKVFAEKVIKAMDDRLDDLDKELDLMIRYGGGNNLLKGIENLKTFRKCIVNGGKKMENEKKTYSDFVDVATDLYKRGLVGLVMDDTGISIDTSDIYHHFHKCEKKGSIFTHSSITHSHKGIDRIIDFEEAIEIIKTFEKEVIEITDLKSLQKVKEGANGVLANREKFSVVRDHTKYGGSNTLGISFETKDIVNLPLTVLMGATIKQERD